MRGILNRIQMVVDTNYQKLIKVDYDQTHAEGLITFEYLGQDIYDPFLDETLRFKVNSIDYYGEENLKQMWSNFLNSLDSVKN